MNWRWVGVPGPRASTWRSGKRAAHDVIGKLVETRFAPTQRLDMAIEVDVIGALAVAVVTYPALVAILAGTPLHEGRFTDPGVIVVLVDAAILAVIGGIERLRIALREHDDVRVGQRAEGGLGGKFIQHAFQSAASGFMGEDGVQQVVFDA